MTITPCVLCGLVAALFLAFSLLASPPGVAAAGLDSTRLALERKYNTPHSYGKDYVFSPRDGWETVNTTNLRYKYSDSDSHVDGDIPSLGSGRKRLEARARRKGHAKTKLPAKGTSNKAVTKFASLREGWGLKKILESFRGIGKAEPVVITWYTGHDLLNPSCWSDPVWTPTDDSFVAALTLDGWSSKPKCFKFLELCHGSEKCVFVRVVDSCAGCAKNSKHVDLTQAAFKALADLETGLLTVQMRGATDPQDGWLEEFWGPKSSSKRDTAAVDMLD